MLEPLSSGSRLNGHRSCISFYKGHCTISWMLIMSMCMAGHLAQVVELLIQHKADVRAADEVGSHPLPPSESCSSPTSNSSHDTCT
jgi:hypothetical protein